MRPQHHHVGVVPGPPITGFQSKFQGFISKFSKTKQWGFIRTEDDEDIFFHRDDVNLVRGHCCHFTEGCGVTFRIKADANHGRLRRCWDVSAVENIEFPEIEESTVIRWVPKGCFGFADRDGCKCRIYFNHVNIITLGEENLKPGSRIRHRASQPEHGRALAVCVEIFK